MVQVIHTNKRDEFRDEKSFLAKQVLQKMRKESEEEYAARLAKEANYPYIDLNIIPLNTDFIRLVPEDVATKHQFGTFLRRGRTIYVALTDPKNSEGKQVAQAIADNNGWSIVWYVVSNSSMERLIQRYRSFSLFESFEKMKLELSEDDFSKIQKQFSDLLALKKKVFDLSTTETFSLIVASAVSLRASDIHFEPQEKSVRMRYRMDGVLQDVGYLPYEVYKFIVSRVKMMGKMKINIRKSAQDGHFSFEVTSSQEGVENRKIDIRASILPGRFGETIVMRILEQKSVFLGVGELGLRGRALEQYTEELKKSNGMIVTTGPTGSGKTTLLYSSLQQINKPGVKIITIEDPVEYEIENVSQTNVSKEDGYTFSTGLRSIVRQDPDVILVGEIRDDDTANIAVQSALTGHLVFTTLHTNSASGAIPRLINLGVKPSLIPSAINAFVAQRLVRRLCEKCKEEYVPANKTMDMIARILSIISPKADVDVPKEIRVLYRSKGCPHCNYTGYKGRIGIFEVLFITDAIRVLIEKIASEDELAAAAMEDGMMTMTQDGILKAVEGITSIEEVWRVGGQFRFLEDVYEKLMTRYLDRSLFIGMNRVRDVEEKVAVVEDFQRYLDALSVEDILPTSVAYALMLGAEDIHIEPEEGDIHIRLRIDGVLHSVAHINAMHYPVVMGKIKLLSGLKTEEQVGQRDSRFTIKREIQEEGKIESVDVRVSIILGGYGETAVLRLLNIGAQSRELSLLGVRKETFQRLENAIKIPNGVILTTGPTGSGKSTTLYSILSKMNDPSRKIMTVEDPIEYRLNGVLQTQVDESRGYTFSNALRSLLRQNPDVLLIGEIRDEETAQMAVQSSLTGHLVFSTLHTNDAPSAVQRLINMGVSAKDLVTAVNFIMAQRLVRTLCSCKKKRMATEEEQREMRAMYMDYVERAQAGSIPDLSSIYEAVGCKKCRGLGYLGMSMISEAIDMKDDRLRQAILDGVSGLDLRYMAIERGMIPMVIDGIDNVLAGTTSLEEIRRVTEM